ncbi:MAG TPA: glycosyltransferase [Terracidiphilus sp.]|nr:glycosyltransferase [Terracidiphilus sp.]
MRVAVVTRYFPSSGEPTAGRSLYQTLRILSRNTDVRVFYPHAAYPSLLRPHSRTYDQLDKTFKTPEVGVEYHDFPAIPLISRAVSGITAAHVLLPHVQAFAPDLVFGCFLYPAGFAALKIGKALSAPVVVMSIGSDINRIGDPVSALLTRRVLRECDYLVTVSGDLHTKALTMGASPARSRAIVNGCDLSVFHVRSRDEARNKLGVNVASDTVVYIGRVDVNKGLRELVEAAASIRPQRPGLEVYLVGDGPDKPLIQKAIQAHNAEGYIHVLPGCSFDDVAVWMAAADVVTLPSYMEGCPNVVLEALACGRPVVATQVGGIPEIMNNNYGRLVPPRDASALARALAEVLDQTWDEASISASCGRSWNTVAAELVEVFESTLNGSRAVSSRGSI